MKTLISMAAIVAGACMFLADVAELSNHDTVTLPAHLALGAGVFLCGLFLWFRSWNES